MDDLAENLDKPRDQNLNNIILRNPKSINTDSRSIKPGDIFLALRGQIHDGHDHIVAAIAQGASVAVSEIEIQGIPQEKLYLVKNTLQTYHQLASLYIKKIKPIVIAITGSSGKTTTKEILNCVLKRKFRTHSTAKNFNNEIGVPKTILEMPEDTQVLILEMGMRGLGEISLLSKTASPNIALITNIGTAHIERLGSVENIRKAKLEIIDGLSNYHGWRELEETFVIDTDNYARLQELKTKLPKQTLVFDSSPKYKLNTLSSPGLNADANAVAIIASLLGLTEAEIQAGLLEYSPGAGRGGVLTLSSGDIVIDDSYNANPESVRNSVQGLIKTYPDRKKIAVIGTIAESEASLVHELFEWLASMPELELLDVRAREIDSVTEELKSKLDGNSAVLIKASRVAGLERVIALL